ncbi:MAG TPA: hypothetical protein VG873_02785 [Burkholderiales bacterium]|nr:hypothetical protein [Burkholderiales bacterium]
MGSSVYSRALQKAAELMGSYQKLSRYLQVPAADLQRWIDDKAIPPVAVFLKVIDFILDESPPPAESDAGEPPAPRDAAPSGDASSTRY